MKRRTFTTGLCGCALAGALGGCRTAHETGPVVSGDASPGYRPNMNSDEAGLWLQSDEHERSVRASRARIRDKVAESFIKDVVCGLAHRYCPDLRSYILRVPLFNATCSPNGMVQVYSGLLLRARNEAQLAAVLGHEIGHYLKKHSLQRLRDTRNATDMSVVFGLVAGALGSPQGSQNLNLLLRELQIAAFSRDNEREADDLGLTMMSEAGYDPYEAAGIWKRLMDERKASDEPLPEFDVFSATHPSEDERIETLTKAAEKRTRPAGGHLPNRLPQAIKAVRGIMLEDEINLGHFKQSEKLFDMIIADGHDIGEVLYFKGELYRRRGKHNDDMAALGFYHEACELPGAPPAAFRQVGLMRWRRDEKEVAREYFRRYLRVAPDAPDREMIRKYVEGA
ncbi:MAG: hypothetical protein EPN20_14515 [Magnetospirillum sp.]|nr:MAG: hypothetical protein EPN20_14515 [Magnetospirillum sp.]